MMRIWTLILALAMFPTMALAQTVSVQSGEHQGFSRLVLTFPDPIDWQFGRTLDGYELRLPEKDFRFDLSKVFSHISRDRLTAIWVDPAAGALRLTMRCTCHATVFSFQPKIVVIDIADGPPTPGSGFEMGIDAPNGPALRQLTASSELRPKARPTTPSPRQKPAPLLETIVQAPTRPRPTLPLPLGATDPRVSALQDRLLFELAQTAARGLVEPVHSLPKRPEPPKSDPSPSLADTSTAAPRSGQLRVLPGAGNGAGDLTARGSICLPDSDLDVASWGSETPLPAQIAAARAGLVGEFDEPDIDSVLELTRLYLYAGFGAEAENLLVTLSPGAPQLPIVRVVAAVLDEKPAPDTFAGMADCDSAVALWAVLSEPDFGKGNSFAQGAVVRAFSELPLHLRRHLGPALTLRLLAAGADSAAQMIRNAVQRASGGDGEALDMIDARLDLARGAVVEAEAKLSGVVAADGPQTPMAFVALAESVVDRGGALNQASLIALEAVERENRATSDGPALRLALARALAAAGEYRRAFVEMGQNDPKIRAAVWQILATRGEDKDLLQHAVAIPSAETLQQAGAATPVVAERLLAIGFPDAALAWIPQDGSDRSRLLNAKATIGLRDGRAALRALSGLEGADAQRLRAQAHQLLGQSVEAVAVLAATGQVGDAAAVAWRAQDWQGVRSVPADISQVPGLRTLDRLMSLDQSVAMDRVDDAPGPLASGRDLLKSTEQTRSAIADLLADVPRPLSYPPKTGQ
ncbi:MAG: hypothetical protein Q7J57_07110 [Gemmobacter sp.]|nr:hypothetical protein [Gemmobacter sp.]